MQKVLDYFMKKDFSSNFNNEKIQNQYYYK